MILANGSDLAVPLLSLSQPDSGTAAVLVDELDAGSLQCLPQAVHCRLPRVRSILDARHGIGCNASSFSEFSNTPTNGRSSHPELNRFHCYIVQTCVDTVHIQAHICVQGTNTLGPEQWRGQC
jgi:hypothetical protein